MATDGIYAYAAGGLNTGLVEIDQFARYSPVSNVWSSLVRMPVPAAGVSLVYAGGKLYAFGGYNTPSPGAVNNTRIYNIATNTWASGAPMPDVRYSMANGYYNGKIYLAGGFIGHAFSDVQNQTWAYDIASNTWTTLASLPVQLGGPASQIVNGHLYVFGGANGAAAPLNTVYDYNIAANSWGTRTPMPTVVYSPGSALYQGTVWVTGGGQPFLAANSAFTGDPARPDAVETVNTTQIYDPVGDTWSIGPAQNWPCVFQAGTTVQGVIVTAGGQIGGVQTAVTEVPIERPLRILIAYADGTAPWTPQNALMAQTGVALVDMFNTSSST